MTRLPAVLLERVGRESHFGLIIWPIHKPADGAFSMMGLGMLSSFASERTSLLRRAPMGNTSQPPSPYFRVIPERELAAVAGAGHQVVQRIGNEA